MSPSAAAAVGVAGFTDVLGLGPCRHVVVVCLIDGLGWLSLQEHAADAPTLAALTRRPDPGRVPHHHARRPRLARHRAAARGARPRGRGVRVPGDGRAAQPAVAGGAHPPPVAVQPEPTVFERVARAGVTHDDGVAGRLPGVRAHARGAARCGVRAGRRHRPAGRGPGERARAAPTGRSPTSTGPSSTASATSSASTSSEWRAAPCQRADDAGRATRGRPRPGHDAGGDRRPRHGRLPGRPSHRHRGPAAADGRGAPRRRRAACPAPLRARRARRRTCRRPGGGPRRSGARPVAGTSWSSGGYFGEVDAGARGAHRRRHGRRRAGTSCSPAASTPRCRSCSASTAGSRRTRC